MKMSELQIRGLTQHLTTRNTENHNSWILSVPAHPKPHSVRSFRPILACAAFAFLALVHDANARFGVVVAWGEPTNEPPILTNVVAIASAYYHDLALKSDGTVAAWGEPSSIPPPLTNVTAVAAGWHHSLALNANGNVISWGDNAFGMTNTPPELSNVIAIATSGAHNLALKANGTVRGWGYNYDGEIDIPPGLSNVIAISAGAYHSLALRRDGTVVGWGARQPATSHIPIGYGQANVPAGLSNLVAISAGGYHNLALRRDGTVVAWGTTPERSGLPNVDYGQTNVPAGLTGVVAIAAADYHSLALKSDGRVVVWGYGSEETNVSQGLSNVVAIASGSNRNLALLNDGSPMIVRHPVNEVVYSGRNIALEVITTSSSPLHFQWQFEGTNIVNATNATLTLSEVTHAEQGIYSVLVSNTFGGASSSNATLSVIDSEPIIVRQPTGQQVLLGFSATLFVEVDGSAPISYQWRVNGTNILGATYNSLLLSNTQFTDAGNYDVVISNSFGTAVSLPATIVASRSLIMAWGEGTYGQTTIPAGLTNVTDVAAGTRHSLALLDGGSVAAWGANDHGQTNVPPGLTGVVALAAGGYHTLALKADGTLTAWGRNDFDQLNVPVGLSNLVGVAAGRMHSLALRRDGTVVGWGRNLYGEIDIPIGLSNIVAIAAGMDRSLALTSDGTMVSWGLQASGPSFPGSGSDASPTDWTCLTAIAAGGYQDLALRKNGTVIASGIGSATSVPEGLTNVVAVRGGGFHSLALKSDGAIIAWGDDGSGQSDVPAQGARNVVAIAAGGKHSLAVLHDDSPYIIRQPRAQKVESGMNAVSTIDVLGAPTLTYQWQFERIDIDGATNATLVVTNVKMSNAGSYNVVVTNSYGRVVSQQATLEVPQPAPMPNSVPIRIDLTNGNVVLDLDDVSDLSQVTVYASTNLVDWKPIWTNSPFTRSIHVTFPCAGDSPQCFYRAIKQ